MNSYGVGGVESRHAIAGGWRLTAKSTVRGFDSRDPAERASRSSALPDPTLYDTYAREQSPCDPITNYAERRGI